MCDATVGVIVAAASVASSVAGGVDQAQKSGHNARVQNDTIKANENYNTVTTAQQRLFRAESLGYQDQTWQQDLDYAGDMLDWAEEEWVRQGASFKRSAQAIEKNTLAATGALMLRQVEEDVANVAAGMEVQRAGRSARGSAAARDRGVWGNSVDAILNDVTRQEGEVLNVMQMNRSNLRRQINAQVVEADAAGDQQLASLQLRTITPATPIRSPSPISSVNPQAVSGGAVGSSGVGQMVSTTVQAVGQGFSTYSAISGEKTSDTFNNIGTWFDKQFTV